MTWAAKRTPDIHLETSVRAKGSGWKRLNSCLKNPARGRVSRSAACDWLPGCRLDDLGQGTAGKACVPGTL